MRQETTKMKRVLSFIMALAMMLSLLPTTVFAAEADTMTIYFENNWKWPDAKIYWWGSESATNPGWSGIALTDVDGTASNGATIYKIEVPTDIDGMLFNGTGEFGFEQSADIKSGWYDGICYYMFYDDATKTKSALPYDYKVIPEFSEAIKVVAIGCENSVTYITSSSNKCVVGEPREEKGEYFCDITVDLTGAEEEYREFFNENHKGYTHSNPQPAIPNEVITVTAKWNAQKQAWTAGENDYPDHYYNFECTEVTYWDVKFDTGCDASVDPQTVENGKTATKPADPTRDGYTFGGWYSDAELTEKYVFSAPVTKDLTLYAKWTATVTFNSNGGSAVTAQTVAEGGKATEPTDPTKEGHTFSGWYSDADLTTEYKFDTAVAGNITLYAKWDINKYNVTFNGINLTSDNSAETIEHGAKYEATFTAVEGYKLPGTITVKVGENTLAEADYTYTDGKLTIPEGKVTGALTITVDAIALNSYEVKLNLTGLNSSNTAKSVQEGKVYETILSAKDGYNLPVNTSDVVVSVKGKEIEGVCSQSDSAITITIPANQINGDIEISATGVIKTYTVTFNSNDSSDVKEQTVNHGAKATEPTAPTKEDYTFDGWYTDKECTTAYDFSLPVTADLTLYAKWLNVYTVTFSGTDPVVTQSVTAGETAEKPADPTKKGHTFGGWYTDEKYTTAYNFETTVAADVTLYAKWTPIVLNVTFVTGDEATTVPSQNPHYGEPVTEPTDAPEWDGHTFGGWYIDKECTTAYDFSLPVTADLTLYAKWTENTPEESDTITIYFENNWKWPDASVYYWNENGNNGWPGTKLTEVVGQNNEGFDIYKVVLPADVDGIIFSGTGEFGFEQSADIKSGWYDGICYYMTYDSATNTKPAGSYTYTPAPGGGGEPTQNSYYLVGSFNGADYNGNDYQFVNGSLTATFTADSYVVVKDTAGDWYLAAEYCTDTSVTLTKGNSEKMLVPAGTYTFTLVENEGGTLTLSYVAAQAEPGETVSYEATFHFINTLNWNAVNLYTWTEKGGELTGKWPGNAVKSDGAYYTETVAFEAAEGADLNFIFNNGSTQTVDLTLPASAFTQNNEGVYVAEKYVALTTQTEGKYNAAIVNSPEAIVTSPIVAGDSVTFNYGDNSANSVSVAGSFNEWSATANTMTKNSEGVWTATIKDLPAGDYQYKFVVNGTDWVIDPMNSNVVTESSGNQNSAFYILSDETVEDNNKVTINIHYKRTDGNYTGWNLWVWGSALGGRKVDFTAEKDGAKVATIVLENAREHQSISFKERLSVEGNEWKEQASSDRSIDLSTIVSGTIDYYIDGNRCVYGNDVIRKNKIKSVELDYDNGVISITSVQAIANAEEALTLMKGKGEAAEAVAITVTAVGSKYSLALPKGMELKLSELYLYQVDYYGDKYDIAIDAAYASDRFATEYTYTGTDLGATYTSASTKFKVWAPTATAVSVKLYTSGTEGTEDLIETVTMTGGTVADKGVWTATVERDLNGKYYTYAVTVDGKTVEAVDPYARTTGVNGDRGMVIDLSATAPADGWTELANKPASYTDAIIYELHVRDFSNHASSGVSDDNRGKFMAFTETNSTAMKHLTDMGITHLHLLPIYDYGSVDETKCENFNWGYDPVNYNVPEGSYSTNPYNGATRVKEMKEMVDTLHENGIGVIMDVVYNHVYNADRFCYNNIVPGYFSRVDSNTSGCGNDTASEREMVRKYIVESVLYWAKEYHIDGFRFDLVGLLDVETINQIVTEVHAYRRDIIFYGEGWDMDGTNKEPGTQMAKQGNASKTPGFAYFSDSIRNGVGGSNGTSTGFASGAGNGTSMATEWLAKPWWTSNPTQVIQYASCHDNYTLADKIVLSTGKSKVDGTVVKMNNLAAAFYMTAQGVPFIHAGEEILREKLEVGGGRCENSYNAPDSVNNIDWGKLTTYADNVEYYKGLIAFRKAHPALRYDTAAEVKDNVQTYTSSNNLIAMQVDGYGANDDDIFVIFNASGNAQTVNLPAGTWTININGDDAGTTSLGTASGSVSVAGISAMVLTKADEGKDETVPQGPSEEKTIYFSNNKRWETVYAYAWTGDTKHLGDWPGVAMTYVETNDYGEDIYCVTLPASASGIDGVIFHNNAGSQTVDIVPGVDGIGYYCTDANAEGKFEVGTYTYRAPVLGGAGDYFLIGYINNADYAGTNYKFVDGKVTATFSADSYVYIVNGDNTETYMTDGYLGTTASATLKDTAKHTLTGEKWDKLLIPGGAEVTITMVKNDDNTITLSYEASVDAYEDKSGIQNGVTLHAWNWSFDNITANMATIADMGYTAIQTSPIQVMKEATSGNTVGKHWWVYYQPVDFKITTDNGNALGTKTDFAEMCAEAEKYGIKVIVDVVANHLGNAPTGSGLSDAIPEYLRKTDYWHDITQNITSWEDRGNMTQRCLDGLPDLNTANKEVQGYVLAFLKECVDAGADGFRFDMAKSIETPKDNASFASDFWPTVVGGIQEYAGGDLYIYGEILDDAKIAISAYTEYMSVTDNGWGNHMRSLVASGNAGLVQGFYKSADASNLVIWAESHDTFATADANQSSAGVSEANINKTWALVAARKDAMGLYLARPASTTQALGVASATGWDNPEVEAVNEFHNAFIGKSETIGNSGMFSYVVRDDSGIVIVNVGGTTAEVELAVSMADGTYTDQISGNTFTVASGKISGKIGETGIAVVYEPEEFEVEKVNMRFGSDLSLLFAFEQSELSSTEGVYAKVTRKANGTAQTPVNVAFADWTMTEIDNVDYYVVEFDGFAAKEMTDMVTVQIYDAEGNALSDVRNISIRDYAMDILSKTDNAEYKRAIVDMLNYGAAAQTYFGGYNAAEPANKLLSDEQKALASSAGTYEDKREADDTYFVASNLRFVSKINLLFKLDIPYETYAVFTWKDHYGNAKTARVANTEYTTHGGKYVVELDELVVADARQLVTCTIYNAADDTVLTTVVDSVESNVARRTATASELYVSFMKFADAAYAYLSK